MKLRIQVGTEVVTKKVTKEKTMKTFTKDDAEELKKSGTPMLKKPNPVYMTPQTEDFEVETNEGTLKGKGGDYVAYDPISGHVWPVSKEYVAMHYGPA